MKLKAESQAPELSESVLDVPNIWARFSTGNARARKHLAKVGKFRRRINRPSFDKLWTFPGIAGYLWVLYISVREMPTRHLAEMASVPEIAEFTISVQVSALVALGAYLLFVISCSSRASLKAEINLEKYSPFFNLHDESVKIQQNVSANELGLNSTDAATRFYARKRHKELKSDLDSLLSQAAELKQKEHHLVSAEQRSLASKKLNTASTAILGSLLALFGAGITVWMLFQSA